MAQTHHYSLEDFQAIDPEGGRGGRWLCPTPQCSGHRNPRMHRSVSMDMATGLWNCKRGGCHAQGQLKEFWKPLEENPFRDRPTDYKTRQGRERLSRREQAEKSLMTTPTPRPAQATPISEVAYRSGTMRPIMESDESRHFLRRRGFEVEDFAYLHQMGVRFASNYARREATPEKRGWDGASAIVFPVRDENDQLVATQGRFIAPGEGMLKTISLGPIALGAFRAWGENEPPIAIVEAPLDALALGVAGVQAFALCGCRPLPAWLLDLAFTHRFWLAFDADNAGDEQSEKTMAELRSVGACASRLRPEGAKDWAEIMRLVGAKRLRGWLLDQSGQ